MFWSHLRDLYSCDWIKILKKITLLLSGVFSVFWKFIVGKISLEFHLI